MNKITVTLFGILLLLSSCTQYAPYNNKDVSIDIRIKQSSYTFMQVEFTPSNDAYYYVGIIPFELDYANPDIHDTHFETLLLDSAMVEYMHWRHELLIDKAPNIASFADHVLSYGKTDHYFLDLMRNSTYLVFAFVVDPDRLVPASDLFFQVVTTDSMKCTNVNFDFTIDDEWDFVYPLNDYGEVNADVPYYVMFASQKEIKDDTSSWNSSPFLYFISHMSSLFTDKLPEKYYTGVSMRRHDYSTSDNHTFVDGVTYYVGIGTTDVVYREDGVTVYRFEYHKDDTVRRFSHLTDTLGVLEW